VGTLASIIGAVAQAQKLSRGKVRHRLLIESADGDQTA